MRSFYRFEIKDGNCMGANMVLRPSIKRGNLVEIILLPFEDRHIFFFAIFMFLVSITFANRTNPARSRR